MVKDLEALTDEDDLIEVSRALDEANRAFATVSYTHLRAHETVLDLVCRLLLEKKKYTITKRSHPLE